ncbi:MAG: hypothetical protein GOV01_03670 [Candidatus Altiarchaeota archaeon]|nr:hypothetical protein [Candidatus Altiarchaeota archaeon]
MFFRRPKQKQPNMSKWYALIEEAKGLAGRIKGVSSKAPDLEGPLQIGKYLETEVPIHEIESNESCIEVPEGIIIMPHGYTHISLDLTKLPEDFRKTPILSVHSTSTFGRCGINITHEQGEYQKLLGMKKLPKKLRVVAENFGPVPVMIKKNDPVRVVNMIETMLSHGKLPKTKPRTDAVGSMIELHAGNELLVLDPKKLPIFKLQHRESKRTGEVPVLIPNKKVLASAYSTEKLPKEGIKLRAGQFVVFSVKEQIKMPKTSVGQVHSAHDNLAHATSVWVHPGWEGRLALEFRTINPVTIKPGDTVAMMSMHNPQKDMSKKQYSGKYQRQKHIIPK